MQPNGNNQHLTMLILQREDWDSDQLLVIGAGHHQRLLVEAGPGTGKTAVACARIAHLVEKDGIAESNIWMISFTRTAVAEIRSRLQSYVGEAAFSIKVATVDSHAWAIHSGHDPTARLTGSYEENIDRVIELICSDDAVQEELEHVEHLVVDEAQDLVGNRAQLVGALIRQLNSGCGITVFADSAQAIYGFSEDDTGHHTAGSKTLVDKLASPTRGFEKRLLRTVHRTSSPGLKRIFGDVRASILRGSEAPEGLFVQTHDSISEHADQAGLTSRQLELDSVPSNSLVLFRSRAEALRHSQFCKRPHCLRLSGFGLHLPAWLAICLGDYTDPAISEDAFLSRWAIRVEPVTVPDHGPKEAWKHLLRTGGNRDGSVSLSRLRARLSRSSPPIDLCKLDFGLPGPIIGTIHASKGREADNVTMLMPRQRVFDDPVLEAEETRILFVGATRAREELRVGQVGAYSGSSLAGGRALRIGANGNSVAMVEIGRPGDLTINGLAGRKNASEPEYLASQKHLQKHSSMIMPLELQADPEMDWRQRVVVPENDFCVGIMSNAFKSDLWEVASVLGLREGRKLRPGRRVRYVRALGARTVVVSEDDPERETLHPAAARTGFLLAPMMAAFTNVYFNSY